MVLERENEVQRRDENGRPIVNPNSSENEGNGNQVGERNQENSNSTLPSQILRSGGRTQVTHVAAIGSVEKLEGRENYNSWAFSMKMLLIREGSWRTAVNVVDGAYVDPEVSERALATIALHVDKRNFSLIRKCDTAKEAWTALKKAFDDNGFAREISLIRKMCNIWLSDCESVENYIDQLLTTAQNLEEIGFMVEDRWLIGLMLKGLPEDYDPLVMSLENCGVELTADMVKSKILQCVNVSRSRYADDKGLAMATKNGVKGNKKNVTCFKCNKKGHYSYECGADSETDTIAEKTDHVPFASVAAGAF